MTRRETIRGMIYAAVLVWVNAYTCRTWFFHPTAMMNSLDGYDYHRAWHASANGRPAEVDRDGLGFLVVHPRCEGACREMTYDGGRAFVLSRLLGALAILGVLGYAGACVRRQESLLESGCSEPR